MPRSERLYLTDIVQATETIGRFVAGRPRDDFIEDELLHRAVLQLLLEIGEVAARLSPDLRRRYPDIDWRRVVAFRNLAVHAYFAVDWDIVWEAASRNAPELGQRVAEILAHEYPADPNLPAADP